MRDPAGTKRYGGFYTQEQIRDIVAYAKARHIEIMPEVDLPPFQPRSLEAMCLENAVEGCVRETFGALVTGWQARTAGDAEVRRALGPISRDELRHAELAWAVDDWAAGRLTPVERERIRQARREALSVLEKMRRHHLPRPALAGRG